MKLQVAVAECKDESSADMISFCVKLWYFFTSRRCTEFSWRAVQGVPRFSRHGNWGGLQMFYSYNIRWHIDWCTNLSQWQLPQLKEMLMRKIDHSPHVRDRKSLWDFIVTGVPTLSGFLLLWVVLVQEKWRHLFPLRSFGHVPGGDLPSVPACFLFLELWICVQEQYQGHIFWDF